MAFVQDPEADIDGTSLVAEITIAPAQVVRALGAPHRRVDMYKVSGMYSFVDGSRVFTLYDWKSTSLYDEELPSPLAFWNCRSKVCLSVGGNCEEGEGEDFVEWLLEEVARKQKPLWETAE